MSYSARKPYLRLKKSITDFFRAPAVFINKIHSMFSEFEKPYLEGEYPQMHLEWPKGDWGGEGTPKLPLSPFGRIPRIFTVGCVVHCWHWNDCEDWLYCSVLHWSGDLNKEAGSFEVGGDILEWEWSGAPTDDIRIRVNSDISSPVVTVKYTDPEGNRCYDDLTIDCVTCNPAAVIGYTNTQMQVDGEQTLEAQVGGELDSDTSYTWAIVSGGGTLSSNSGNSVVYTAPSANAYCLNNPTITLSCEGVQLDSIDLAINAVSGSVEAALEGTWGTPSPPYEAYGYAKTLNCNSSWWDTVFWGRCTGAPDYIGTTTAGVCGSYGSLQSCIDNCIISFMNGVVGFTDFPNDVVDTRDEELIEDGCCPRVLL